MTVSSVDERLVVAQLALSGEDARDRQDEEVRHRASRLVALLGSVAMFIALYDLSMLSGIQRGIG